MTSPSVPDSFASRRRSVARIAGPTTVLDAKHQLLARAFRDPAQRGQLLENPDPELIPAFRPRCVWINGRGQHTPPVRDITRTLLVQGSEQFAELIGAYVQLHGVFVRNRNRIRHAS